VTKKICQPQNQMIKNYHHIKILNILNEHFKCFILTEVWNEWSIKSQSN